jgi:SecD/SecF fusion protein
MSKSLRWKILMILGVIALLAWASFPLTETSVKDYIARTAVDQDESFRDLLSGMDQEYSVEETRVPVSGIERLKEQVAASGIDLTRYFPGAGDNKEAIGRIEKATKGKLNLGLDLRGGMHVILAVDELELLKKGAAGVDEEFNELFAAAQERAATTALDPLTILREEVEERGIDLVWYYRDHYQNKYDLDEEQIVDNSQVFEYFRTELQAASLGALEILRNRVDKFGVSEPEIQRQGANELLIQLPGVRDPEQTLELIQGQAFLEFKLVDDDPERLERALETGTVPPGFSLKNHRRTDLSGRETEETFLLVDKSDLSGEHLVTAYMGTRGDTGEPIVNFKFDRTGARIFSRITKQYNAEDNPPGRRLALLLDGNVLSAPNIRTHIPGGQGYIEGNFTFDTARLLASQLSAGAYPAPLLIREQRSVGPSLGADSIRQGIQAALAGLIVVIIFMAAYYLLAGLVADFALCLNIGFIIGILCLLPFLFRGFKATLTLPGIAGIILTIGMAVDANILIFERIREELATGKKIKRAIASGYEKVFLTIFDANLTTLIAALILLNPLGFSFLPTAGPIKGFALTLTVGICASMFTALVVTRVVFDLFGLSPRFTALKMLQIFKNPNFDFIGQRRIAFFISGLVIAGSLTAFIVNGEKNFGIDFTGGILIQRQFTAEVPADKIREVLAGIGLGGASVQQYGGGTGVIIRAAGTGESAAEIDEAIREALPGVYDPAIFDQRTEMVGPKVGQQLRIQALGAVILAMGAIMAYIWLRFVEFKFALGAVLALFHDVVITIGFLAGLFILPIREFNIQIIAALLTIVGYSLNDTIVVFVRIRENMKAMRGESDEKIINTSINQVLNRTLLTSLTSLIVVIFLFIFGGEVINDFAYALMVGVVVGTYSSIFVASPVLLLWHRRKAVGK